MRAFSVEKFTKHDLEHRFQEMLAEGSTRLVLTSKKQYTVWARTQGSVVLYDYADARKMSDACIGVYKDMSVVLNLPPQKSKFNAQKVKADGYTFDSKDEYKRYLEIKNDGKSMITAVHPKFTLMAGFRDNKGVWHRPIEYEADFSYYTDGILYIEDRKGLILPDFKIKWKMFVHQMGAIDPEIVCLATDSKGKDIFAPKPRKARQPKK